MTYAETILPEFDHEMANTRKVLERVPEDKLDWKAHPKSHTIGCATPIISRRFPDGLKAG